MKGQLYHQMKKRQDTCLGLRFCLKLTFNTEQNVICAFPILWNFSSVEAIRHFKNLRELRNQRRITPWAWSLVSIFSLCEFAYMSGNSTHLNTIGLNKVGSCRPSRALTGRGRFRDRGQVSSAAGKWHLEPLDRFSSGWPAGHLCLALLSLLNEAKPSRGEPLTSCWVASARGFREKLRKSKIVKEEKFQLLHPWASIPCDMKQGTNRTGIKIKYSSTSMWQQPSSFHKAHYMEDSWLAPHGCRQLASQAPS